jgi:hypothetical protein
MSMATWKREALRSKAIDSCQNFDLYELALCYWIFKHYSTQLFNENLLMNNDHNSSKGGEFS